MINTSSNGIVAFENELNSIVHEYLEYGNYEKTLVTFSNECTGKKKPLSVHSSWIVNDFKKVEIQRELLTLFHDGSRREYFMVWDEWLPEITRQQDQLCQRLEFYLNIYFAIYPIRNGIGKDNKAQIDESMMEFKNYLETRGAALSQTMEFLPYYALPFVPNPTAHVSFRELFTDQWVPDLQTRLEKFLTLTLKSSSQPRLFDLYKDSSNKDTLEQIEIAQQQLVEAEKGSMKYRKRYNKLQSDYHNLIGITAELVDSLEATVNGTMVTPEYLQNVCMRLFSSQVGSQSIEFRPGTAGSVLRQSVANPKQDDNELYPSLDYIKIKDDIAYASDRTKSLLLQALRWRLTHSNSGEQRDTVINAYIANDVIGCGTLGAYQTAVLELLQSKNPVLRQYIARLFNAFASMATGRTYLSTNIGLVEALEKCLHVEDKNSLTKENILGALQKLSLRRALQTAMIQHGMIEYLVSELQDNDSLSDYLLEYSVALLMNLCLRSSGKSRCSQDAPRVLKVLSDLLGHDNAEIRPYVNGALYSILSVPPIREEAKAMGMEEILNCFMKDENPDMNRQIEFIIKQLNSDETTTDSAESDDEDEEEDEEDQDAMEADLDKDEIVRPTAGEFFGEKLLTTEYLGMMTNSTQKTKKMSAMDEPLTRPVTPGHWKLQHDITQSKSLTKISESKNVHLQPRPPTAPSQRNTVKNDEEIRPRSTPEGGRGVGVDRPPTRSGSRTISPGVSNISIESITDSEYDKKVVESIGSPGRHLVKGAVDKSAVKPSNRVLDGDEYHHYTSAFSTRPKIPRTPDHTVRRKPQTPPTPQPQISSSPPKWTSRPGSANSKGDKSSSQSSTLRNNRRSSRIKSP